MTSVVPNDFLAEARAAVERPRIGAVEPEQVAGRAELGVVRRARVEGDRDAADRGRDRDGEERHHQHLLPPLAAEHAPRPADDRSAGGDAAVARASPRRVVSERRHRRSPAASSDSGPGGATVWSTTRPSRRNTTRSAQDARCASWVTTTPATPRVRGGPQQTHDGLAVHGVERAGRLVGEQQPALADDRPGDRDPLALAARELVRDSARRGPPPRAPPAPRARSRGQLWRDAVELERQGDVLGRGQPREQVEVLEDVADRPASQPA